MNNIYVFGSKGQDGQLLTYLLKEKYKNSRLILFNSKYVEVFLNSNFIKKIYLNNQNEYLSIVASLIEEFKPKLIFYLAAVHISSQEKEINIDFNRSAFVNYFLPFHILNQCILYKLKPRFLFASSSLIFSDSDVTPQYELLERKPSCIYSKQKVLTENYLKTLLNFDIPIYVVILYNHESHLRSEKFFTKKVISSCNAVVSDQFNKAAKPIRLFNPDSLIDMGYANEYVKAMINLINNAIPGDYIFATKKPIKVKDFVDVVMDYYSLSEDIFVYLETKPRFKVPLIGDNLKVYKSIGWRPDLYREKLAVQLCNDYKSKFKN
tara:strand:+ start:2120 stop:3085 length:966 start_codon:yes stop_codon:yes gene_type:complete